MAYDGTFTKQSAEAYAITVDFATHCLQGAEAIDTYAVTATKISDSSDVSSTVLDSDGESEAAGVVTAFVQAGTNGESYKITVTATSDTDPAAIYESDILMVVSDT